MSVAKLAMTPQTPFICSLPQICPERQFGEAETLAKHYEVLSRLSVALSSHRPEDLPCILGALIRPLLDVDFLDLIVFKEGTSEVLRHHVGAGQFATLDVPMEETTYWWVYQQERPLYISDWERDERFPERREALKKLGFEYRSLCRLPLRTQNGPIGVLSFASFRPHDYSEEEMRFLSLAAGQISLAVASEIHLERSCRAFSELTVKSARLKLLVDLTNSLIANPDLDDLLKGAIVGVKRVIQSDFAIIGLLDLESDRFGVNAFDFRVDNILDRKAINSLGAMLGAPVFSTGKPWSGRIEDLTSMDANGDGNGVPKSFKNSCALPLISQDRTLGILAVGRREDAAYTRDEIDFLTLVSSQVAMAVDKTTACGGLRRSKGDYGEARVGPEDESTEPNFKEIVGRSGALQRVLRHVGVVAPTDSAVLIKGETGTGKELIAQAIHDLSTRRDRPLIKLNCAAIPSGLLESELFGHEKGAFTGALMRKAGRFEAADKGTLLLDEVGDIPLELQPKLLRVLQEHEFERLGSTRTLQVDVRIIAATHRDLMQMVEDGEFRSDLYYRLHVFPLTLPPLRDRREDIPMLVRHYVDKYSKRMNRRIKTILPHTMEDLIEYPWPGNVRELQNVIERAVILSPGNILRSPLSEMKKEMGEEPSSMRSTLEEAEREHVLQALRQSNWVIGGPGGAAKRLGIKRTTLAYRIRKLKIPCRPQ
jgi:formate hydrogenlyase transcriptional activator